MNFTLSPFFFALIAYLFWGMTPIYWKQLNLIPPLEILGHRLIWSTVFLAPLFFFKNGFRPFFKFLSTPAILKMGISNSLLLSINWLTFIWGVQNGYILEASLGYFICPILSFALGVLWFQERPNSFQWTAFFITFVSVSLLVFKSPTIPWVALIVASTFALYSLNKKQSPIGHLDGLTLEVFLLMIPSLFYMGFLWHKQTLYFPGHSTQDFALIISTGLVTVFPLILFSVGIKGIDLTLLGFVSFITPTMQFFLGWLLYNEPLTALKGLSFSLIWVSVLFFLYGQWVKQKNAVPLLSGKPALGLSA